MAIADYGVGNHASVVQTLRSLGFRVRVSTKADVLEAADVLLLPGVGAFPSAMQSLHEDGLIGLIQARARENRPILGICLGMQLLLTASHEHQYTSGLNLIPGEAVTLPKPRWHIGWNTVELSRPDPLLQPMDGQAYYFNHSFYYDGPAEYAACVSRHIAPFTSVIRRGRVVGVQFHPEKSQAAGRLLLRNLISGLADA